VVAPFIVFNRRAGAGDERSSRMARAVTLPSASRLLLPLAAAGLIGLCGAALAPSAIAQSSGGGSTTPTPRAQNAPDTGTGAGNGEQTLQNNSATRALDRAAGTNTSGAYPTQSDGTPANPPGTAATRALDRAAGTNASGAYPQNEGNSATPPAASPSPPTAPNTVAPGTGAAERNNDPSRTGMGGGTPSR
jgi:hypothetical protein